MLDSIYQEVILDHYHNPQNHGVLSNPSYSITVNNPLCGDKITMAIIIANDQVHEIKFTGEGCAISIAASSMLTQYAKGKTKEELRQLDKDFIIAMLGIALSPNRLKCALLPLEALKKLLTQ